MFPSDTSTTIPFCTPLKPIFTSQARNIPELKRMLHQEILQLENILHAYRSHQYLRHIIPLHVFPESLSEIRGATPARTLANVMEGIASRKQQWRILAFSQHSMASQRVDQGYGKIENGEGGAYSVDGTEKGDEGGKKELEDEKVNHEILWEWDSELVSCEACEHFDERLGEPRFEREKEEEDEDEVDVWEHKRSISEAEQR